MDRAPFTFYEFFAGGGMARAGLNWTCLFANELEEKKAASYKANWDGGSELKVDDVAELEIKDLPEGTTDLAWASFPCQDLSLAGAGAGLKGTRSGTFHPFWNLIKSLAVENRHPRLVVLENVCGALTSHEGEDFRAISVALRSTGYRFGAVVVDAVRFVPQSRPRLFVIGLRKDMDLPRTVCSDEPDGQWHTESLIAAHGALAADEKEAWIWWKLPTPPEREKTLAKVIEEVPQGVDWHTPAQTARLLELMTPLHLAKVEQAKRAGRLMVGGVYKRTRPPTSKKAEADVDSKKRVQRAEVRFDDVAGCLRTPTGGSSRQSILLVDGESVRSRLLSPREAARLMGLDDSYKLPEKYNDAYHLIGDGLAVPVVRYLAAHILEPILQQNSQAAQQAA